MDKVIVKVRGEQTGADGETSEIELVAEGRHCFTGGHHYVLYEDAMDQGMTSTMLKIAPDFMVLSRSGGVTQEQHFQKDVVSATEYATPFGSMNIAVRTESIAIEYANVSGEINVSYAMAVNGEWQSDNALHIEIHPAEGEIGRLN